MVQGEAYGEGVQGNPLRVKGQHFAAFTLRVDGAEVPRAEWPEWLLSIAVPVVPGLTYPETVEQALSDVDGLKSQVTKDANAEGVVWRHSDFASGVLPDGTVARLSWKAISNKYLLKHDR